MPLIKNHRKHSLRRTVGADKKDGFVAFGSLRKGMKLRKEKVEKRKIKRRTKRWEKRAGRGEIKKGVTRIG